MSNTTLTADAMESQLNAYIQSVKEKIADGKLTLSEIAELGLDFIKMASAFAVTMPADNEEKKKWVVSWGMIFFDVASTALLASVSWGTYLPAIAIARAVRVFLSYALPGIVEWVYRKVVKPTVPTV
jgi:hypothetical protein